MPVTHFIPVLLLCLFGIINLIGVRPDLVFTSFLFFAEGAVLIFVLRFFQVQRFFFRSNAVLFYWFFVFLLILNIVIGIEAKGSKRWLDLYFFQIQTSEIFKVFFIVLLANIFSKVKNPIENSYVFVKTLFLTALPVCIVFGQPDLGSALIIISIYLVMLIHSSVPTKQMIKFFGVVLVLVPLLWFVLQDYQKTRILSFIYPTRDTSGASYNVAQAKIAVGSGTFWGKGLGRGKQSQLHFLPEYHTDFAYASLVEQFGFLGGAIVLLLYVVFFSLLFYKTAIEISSSDKDRKYKGFYLLGISTFIISQTVINIGMNLGLLPVAGITLPFISYGGSSLLTFIIGLALIP